MKIDKDVDESTYVSAGIDQCTAKITDIMFIGSSTALKPSDANPPPISPLDVLCPLSRAYTPPQPTVSNELYECPDVQSTQ